MDTPTATIVRSWEPAYVYAGYPAPPEGQDDPLAFTVDGAVAYVRAMTGRPLDASMPDELRPLAQQAVLLRTKQAAGGGGRAGARAQDSAELKRWAAGDYNQERFSPEELAKGRQLNPWPALSELLWLLATPERRAELEQQLGGDPPPSLRIAGGTTLGPLYG